MVLTPQRFLDLLARQGDELEAHEKLVKAKASAPMRSAFTKLVREVARRWAVLSASVERGDTSSVQVFIDLLGSMRSAVPDLRPAAVESLKLGVKHAIEADGDLDEFDIPTDDLPTDLATMIDETDQAVEEKIDKARKYLKSTDKVDRERVDTAVAIAGRSVNSVEIGASQIAVRGVSEAQRIAGKQTRQRLIWRAERDACLICLAYSGHVSNLDGTFPGGLTFDKHPRTSAKQRVKPPAHPHCRCTSTLYHPRNDPGGLIADSLKREARRSVVKGWALPSESDKARRAAAAALLEAGAGLPKTVEKKARARLKKAGQFSVSFPNA